ncbi:PEP-CTERM sorting domain-containing protein [Mastigocoleus sp. MO_188.B34]|uniref:PEP-CTERM sorting domain-containing protein n=1 Tax=Mastigocoleus sp. MO_188.B34 TaxID=3036635 RepID=UPI00262E1134|nr:PEP-CTERM sorting domain-containing protein [Mastigocoleus sp. MO_188.B34]MDJ0697687.1 PEP-CTERM sorting domain-containing protein [Mastigocoleus sp. MO_188.B34]
MKIAKTFTKIAITVASIATLSTVTMKEAKASSFINFETIPGTTPSDNLAISNQFSSLGVNFGVDNNFDGVADAGLFPQLERFGKSSGDRIQGFVNGGRGRDVAEVGYEDRLGEYFLRTAGLGGDGGALLITYDSATQAASGEIWDIDGNRNGKRTEQWEVQLLGQDKSILDTITSPLGTNDNNNKVGGELDGKPWLFSFERDTADVYGIRFKFTGNSDPSQVGLAFDNFSTHSVEGKTVPEPTSLLGVLIIGMVGGGSFLKQKIQRDIIS